MRAAVLLVVLLCLVMTIAALPSKLNSGTDSDGQGAFNIMEVAEGKVQVNHPGSAQANCGETGTRCGYNSECCSGECQGIINECS
jgi:hypothetical protein